MKKILYFAATLLLGLTITSCDKEDIGGTATESMAGQWYVTIDAVDDSGNPISGGEDYFGVGRVLFLTYNTASNSPTQMWIDDLGAFDVASTYGNKAYPNYAIKSVVNIDQNALTFSSSNAENHAALNSYKSDVYGITVEQGKILKGAGRQNNGSPADSIVFYVKYTNDPWYPDDGYAKYKVSGIRYSGLVEND
ncbi:MAG: hypothetical protein J5548_04900 [Prevotella sp.]|jgi:hypothetical protein|nr:hypothetical protein [Prevotella sp.]